MPMSLFKWLSRKSSRKESSASQPSTSEKPEDAESVGGRLDLRGNKRSLQSTVVKSSLVDKKIIPTVAGLLEQDDTVARLGRAMEKLDALDADMSQPKH